MASNKFDKTSYKKCYESHPVLNVGGGTLVGGNCGTPVAKDADVYIALDSWSSKGKQQYPWNPPGSGPIHVSFSIKDQGIPEDPVEFEKMLVWLCNQLQQGKKVHVGCIGGHGRTGLVIVALLTHLMDEEDMITWVRKNYCDRAVESAQQVDFLVKKYGVKQAKSSSYHSGKNKIPMAKGTLPTSASFLPEPSESGYWQDKGYDVEIAKPITSSSTKTQIWGTSGNHAVKIRGNIWGRTQR